MNLSESYYIKIIEIPAYKKNIGLERVLTHMVFSIKCFAFLLSNVRRNDKIIVSSIPPEVLMPISYFKLKGVRVLLDVRDVWPEALPRKNRALNFLFSLYCYFFYAFSLSFDKITYTAPSFSGKISRFRSNSSKIVFLPLGFDQNRWEGAVGSQEKFFSDEVTRLVYVGSLEAQCPLEGVIAAVSGLDKFRLDIIGDGSKRGFYKQIAGENVFFHGRLNKTSVVKLLKSSHFGVLPFIGRAAMPNKLFDYMAAELPILSIGFSDISDFVREHEIGIGSGFSMDEIINMLKTIDRHSYEYFRQNISKIKHNYGQDELYEKFVELLLK